MLAMGLEAFSPGEEGPAGGESKRNHETVSEREMRER